MYIVPFIRSTVSQFCQYVDYIVPIGEVPSSRIWAESAKLGTIATILVREGSHVNRTECEYLRVSEGQEGRDAQWIRAWWGNLSMKTSTTAWCSVVFASMKNLYCLLSKASSTASFLASEGVPASLADARRPSGLCKASSQHVPSSPPAEQGIALLSATLSRFSGVVSGILLHTFMALTGEVLKA